MAAYPLVRRRTTISPSNPTVLTIDLLEQHLLAAETSVVAVGAARGTLRTPFFEGCSPSPLAPSSASALLSTSLVLRTSGLLLLVRSAAAARARVAGVVAVAAGVVAGAAVEVVEAVEVVAVVGVVAGVGGFGGDGGGSGWSDGSGSGGSGGGRTTAHGGGFGGGQRQRPQRRSETACLYVIRTGERAGQTCWKPHTQHRFFSRLDNAWRAEFGDEAEHPHWVELLRSGVAIFDLDYDAIISAIYALFVSAEGDCYLCVQLGPSIEAVALGASESSLPGTAPAEALHTFTQDSSASRFLPPHLVPCPLLSGCPVDESAPFYRLFPYRSAPPLPPALFLAPGPPPVDPLPPEGPAPSGVSQVDPLLGAVPVEVAGDLGAARGAASRGVGLGGEESGGAESEGAGSSGAEPGGAEPEGTELASVETGGAKPRGFEPRGAESEGAESEGSEPQVAASSGGPAGVSLRVCSRPEPLSPQQLREWLVRCARLRGGAAGARATRDYGARGARVTTRAGGTGGAAGAGPGGARTMGTGAARTGGVEGAGAGNPTEPGAAGVGGARAGGTDAGGAGAGGAGDYGAGAGGTSAGGSGAGGAGAFDPRAGGAGAEATGGTSAGGTVRLRPYFVPLLQQVLGVPSSTALTLPILCPPADHSQPPLQPASPLLAPSPYFEQTSGLTERREPASRPASPVRGGRRVPRPRPPPVPGTHAMALRPSSVPLRVPLPAPPESSLPVVPDHESEPAHAASPTISCLLATVVTDPAFESIATSAFVAEQLDFAATYRLDYATALVAESESASPPFVGGECALGTDVLEDKQEDIECLVATVPCLLPCCLPLRETRMHQTSRPHALRQRRLRCSPVSGEHSQWHVDFQGEAAADNLQIFSPIPKITTLWVLLHVAAQRDYELHSLDFSTAFLKGSLHEEIWLRRPPGFTGTTLAALGFTPSTANPSLLLRTDMLLPPFYVVVYITRDRAQCTITLTQSHMVHHVLQRFDFQFSSPQPTPLSDGHSLTAPPSDESVEPSGPYPELVGCLIYLMTCTRPDLAYPPSLLAYYVAPGRHRKELRWLTYLLIALGEQPRSPPVLYVDNMAMIALCQEHRLEHRLKHIALRYFLARELQQRGQLRLAYVGTRANTADIFTKALPPDDHQCFSTELGLLAFLFLTGLVTTCSPPLCLWGIEAAALGASESSLPGTALAEALHTFTLDSGASHCFFGDGNTFTPLPAPVPIKLADHSGGPLVARSSTVLPCPAVPSGSLSGLHLPSFSTNLVASPCFCHLLSHQTLLWLHRLGHPSLLRLRGMHSRLLVSGLPQVTASPPALTCPALPSLR
ncbi:unnamed protein product [Closterium sp. NIES-53]